MLKLKVQIHKNFIYIVLRLIRFNDLIEFNVDSITRIPNREAAVPASDTARV